MPKIKLSRDEETLLTFLSKKKGPVYVMEQDMPALNSLQSKGLVATNGNVGVVTDEGRACLGPDPLVVKRLKEWAKMVRDPHAERLHEDLGEHANVDPLVLVIRQKLRENGIDPSTVYPVDVGYGDNRHQANNGDMCVSVVFRYEEPATVEVKFKDDTFGGNEERHQEWLGLVGVKPKDESGNV